MRVLHGGRRWWYQSQAVVSERSGLIESSAVWWLHQILRTHGFDHSNLESFVGKPVTSSSWEFGDIVVPSKVSTEMAGQGASNISMESVVGRIVPSASRYKRPDPLSSIEAAGKNDSKTVLVEFVDEKFSKLTGLSPPTDPDETQGSLKTRLVKVSELVHSTVFHGVDVFKKASSGLKIPCGDLTDSMPFSISPEDIVSNRIKKDIEAIAKFDVRAIEEITKE